MYGCMPWLAIPFEDAEKRGLLSEWYKAYGIPHKALINSDTKIITLNLRAMYEDPEGENFPWIPKPFSEILGTTFLSKYGEATLEALENKIVGLYFHAFNYQKAYIAPVCPPQLVNAYEKLRDEIEVIVVDTSRCPSKEIFNEGFSALPFRLAISSAVSFDPRCDELVRYFCLDKIGNTSPPLSANALVMLKDTSGDKINIDALPLLRKEEEAEAGVGFPWPAEPVANFANNVRCLGWDWDTSRANSLLVFVDRIDALAGGRVRATLTPIAHEYLPLMDPHTGCKPCSFGWLCLALMKKIFVKFVKP